MEELGAVDDKPFAFGSGVLVTLPKQVSSSSPAEQVTVIVTNRHVVEDGSRFRVSQGKNHWMAKVRRKSGGRPITAVPALSSLGSGTTDGQVAGKIT